MFIDNLKEVVIESNKLDHRRTRFAAYVAAVSAPVSGFWLLFFADSIVQKLFLGGFFVVTSSVAVYSVIGMSKANFSRVPALVLGIVSIPCLLYFLYIAAGDGASAMWMLLLPPCAMFMLGLSVGSFYSALALTASLLVMNAVTMFPYSYEFIIRFAGVYSLMTAVCFSFEYWRVSLEIEKARLGKELEQTRYALSEFATVCSWCRKIEKADESWQSLEKYVYDNENKQVTHGMCPECEARTQQELQ